MLLAFAAVALLGCDDAPAASSEIPIASASASAEIVDLDEYCETMCERTTRCGLELARSEAGAADRELLGELERDQAAERERCRQSCASKPVGDGDRFQLERAQICFGKTACDELSRCVSAL